MSDGFQFLDIILFAAIAGFLVLRLRSVLGKRTGHQERPQHDPFQQGGGQRPSEQGGRSGEERDKVIPMPGRGQRNDSVTDSELRQAAQRAETPLSAGLTQIKLADPDFDEDTFVQGARAAFEMIVTAYAAGDRDTLRQLLASDVYEDFERALAGHEQAGETVETTLVSIRSAEIVGAELEDRTAFVTVKLVSDQINAVRDAQGQVVEGDPEEVTEITDIWTFARNTRSSDPNWTLVATRSPDADAEA